MKGGFVAVALAALASGASAAHHRHAHEHLFKKGLNESNEICTPGCTTIWKTITGEPTLVVHATKTKTQTHTVTATSTSAPPPPPPPPSTTEVVVVPVPTPAVHTCPTPGTYTFPATTITVTQTTTVCAATSTQVPPGTHTVGGVTTVVVTATTVTCPVATVHTSGTVTTSTIVQTTYVCPSAGTYTIAPITTTVSESTVIVYPTPATYTPGTYTAPEQIVTVTKTGYVTVCPFTAKGLPTSAPAPPPVKSQAPSPPPPPKPTVVPEAPKKSPPSSGLVSNNDHLGITYTPYQSTDGQCKSASDVDADIKSIKDAGFNVVRVYSTDCNTLENVGTSCKTHGLKMIVGVFIKATGCTIDTPDIKEQVDKLVGWNNWDLVELLVVGNEAIMNGFCSAQQLKDLVIAVKGRCSVKYSGKVTVTETTNIWQRTDVSAALCPIVDITGANIQPFFNAGVAPDQAGTFVQGQIDILAKICNKDVISLETGWPSGGNSNGLAVTGPDAQAAAVKSIRSKCGSQTIFFSLHNDLWKDKGPFGCETTFGLAASFGISA